MARKKYTYIPLEEIDYIETVNGKTIEGSELLDGAYARGRKKYSHGGRFQGTYRVINEKTNRIIANDMTREEAKDFMYNYSLKYPKSQLELRYNMTDEDEKSVSHSVDKAMKKHMDGYMAKGGELAGGYMAHEFEVYDEETEKTLLIKARSLEEAEGIAATIDFNDYRDGSVVDVLDEMDSYESMNEYAKGGKLSDEEFIQEAVNYLNYNGFAEVVSDGKDGWLVSYLDEDEDYKDVHYDSQGVVNLALEKRFMEDEEDEYAKGGKLRKHRRRKKSLEERAEELVGSQEWHMLDRAEKADVISEMITEGILPVFAKGGVADAQSYKVKFTLSNNDIVEVDYSSKEDMDNGIADFYLANDVDNVEVIEQEEKKKGLFDMAKKAPAKKSASKEKPEVIVEGIESEIARYDELKEIINNAKAEQEIIGGKLKAIGTEEFLNMYEEDKRKPENFNLADGDEKILFIVMDKYKKVEPEKAAILRKYKGLLEEVTTYSFNPEVLDRVGDVVSNLIMNSDELSDEDKKRLLIVDTTVAVKKGSIDRLMDYDNPEEIYALIEPIVALK